MISETEFFTQLVSSIETLIDSIAPELISKLASGSQIEFQVGIQSLNSDVKIAITTKDRICFRVNSPGDCKEPGRLVLGKKRDRSEISSFTRDFKAVASYHLEKCKFYSLPLELILYLKPDRSFGGRVTSNFCSKPY